MSCLMRMVAKSHPLASRQRTPLCYLVTSRKSAVTTNLCCAHSNENLNEKDRVITVPNLLCVGRIAAAPYLSYSIIDGNLKTSLAIFGLASFSDLLDGWIARKIPGQASKLGSFLDPLADKILVVTLYLSLTKASLIPASLTALIVSRDVLLVYAGLYIRYMSVQPPFTFAKYFDVRLPTAQVNPTQISKINTGFQFLTIGSAMIFPVIGHPNHPLFMALCGITATTTFASALSYAFQRDTYSFKHREYDHQTGKKLSALAVFILFNLGFAAWDFDLVSK